MKIQVTTDPDRKNRYWLWCPGCEDLHGIDDSWQVDVETLTVQPSILVQGGHYAPSFDGEHCWCKYYAENPKKRKRLQFKCRRCHSFIRAGMWEFLGDSTHALAGKTVPMVDLPDWVTAA